MRTRDYSRIAAQVRHQPDRQSAMRAVVDALWDELRETGVSWVGFYSIAPTGGEMILGPRRDKPACSPIGLHGVCGRAWRERRAIVVRDVAELGASYVTCDPRDKSECVVPVFESDGACWGVLDLDSHAEGSFDESDVTGLCKVLRAAGMHTANVPGE